jgi:hypothetical protein
MKSYATNRDEHYSLRHESIKHTLQGERRFEEQKLDRLKKLLQTKVTAEASASVGIRAA